MINGNSIIKKLNNKEIKMFTVNKEKLNEEYEDTKKWIEICTQILNNGINLKVSQDDERLNRVFLTMFKVFLKKSKWENERYIKKIEWKLNDDEVEKWASMKNIPYKIFDTIEEEKIWKMQQKLAEQHEQFEETSEEVDNDIFFEREQTPQYSF
jgi:hypothetical protein